MRISSNLNLRYSSTSFLSPGPEELRCQPLGYLITYCHKTRKPIYSAHMLQNSSDPWVSLLMLCQSACLHFNSHCFCKSKNRSKLDIVVQPACDVISTEFVRLQCFQFRLYKLLLYLFTCFQVSIFRDYIL